MTVLVDCNQCAEDVEYSLVLLLDIIQNNVENFNELYLIR